MKIPLSLGAALAAAMPLTAQAPPLADLGLLLGDDASGPAAARQNEPAIARSDDGYLVVWSDLRGSLGGHLADDGTDIDILAARLDANGALLDTTPIVVTAAFGDQEDPDVAWNGTHWLVTWASQAPTPTYHAAAIQGARISPAGELLDDPPITILAYPWSSGANYALASDDSGWAIVSQGTSAGEEEFRMVRVSAQGAVLDPGGKNVYAPPYLMFDLDLAYANDTYLATWTQTGVRGLLVGPSLDVLSPTPFLISGSTAAITGSASASNGQLFLVTWVNDGWPQTTEGAIRASRVTSAGSILDPNGDLLALGTFGLPAGDPRPTWNGAGWTVVFASGTVALARMDTAGNVLDPTPVVVAPASAGDQFSSVAAPADGGVQVVWQDRALSFDGDVVTRRVDAALSTGPQADVSRGTARQLAAHLVEGGGEILATWISETSSARRALAQRLDARGNALAAPFLVDQGPDLGNVAGAWNGSQWMIAWDNGGVLFARRYSPSFAPLDPFPIFVMSGREAAVAGAGNTFLVAGSHAPVHVHQRNMYGARIDATSGAVLDTTPLFLGGAFANRPEARTFGGQFLVVWQRNVSHDNPSADVRGSVVGVDGSVASFVVASLGFRPAATWNGGSQGLVVWDSGADVRGRRLALDGSFVDAVPFTISAAPEPQSNASVGWTGSEYVVAWEDLRDREAFFDYRTDVYGGRVSEQGVVLDGDGFPIAVDRDPERQPAVVGSAGGPVVVSSRFAREAPHAGYRLQVRGFGDWSSLGNALAGTNGFPALSGSGALAAGSTLTLSLVNALPSAPGLHVVGVVRWDLPLFGGVLVPTPDVLVPFATDAQGAASLAKLLANTPAVPLYVQSWVVDAGAPELLSASNAVTAAP